MPLKETRYINPKLLEFAKNQPCTLNIAGVCRYSKEATVAAHCNFDGGKISGKTHDHSIAFACYWCHGVIDGAIPHDWDSPDEKYFYMGRGVVRTLLIILREKPKLFGEEKGLDDAALIQSFAKDIELALQELNANKFASQQDFALVLAEALFEKGRF